MKKKNFILIVFLLAASVIPGQSRPVYAQIPPAVEKKQVALSREHHDAVSLYGAVCGKCHSFPDPVSAGTMKPPCTRDMPDSVRVRLQQYISDVRKGKNLYESRCGRCHALIDPRSYSADYWSKNLCTSEECFVEKLRAEEEQQVLLYLSSHAK